MSAEDRRYLARAIRLARRGFGTTDPNPRVGCVLVKAGEVVGEGWHERPGGPHAEAAALAAAGERAAGATAYVSLEPCNHVGRTGPCTRALVDAGVERIVCCGRDPNTRVSGGGLEALRAAGLTVDVGLLEAEAADLNPGYFARHQRGRPWLRSKLAASLDGRTALASGASQWITAGAARADVHRFRARSSAILTGIETILADDPQLTARPPEPHPPFTPPWRIVLDSSLRTPPSARLLKVPGRVIIFAGTDAPASRRAALEAAGALVELVPAGEHLDLMAVLRRLAELEVNEVWVEAGARLNGALLAQGLIDELVLYFAPALLGDGARGMFTLGPLSDLADRCELRLVSVRRIGPDLRIVARPHTLTGPTPPV